MAKDLVCKMDVDEKTAKWKTVYKGKTGSVKLASDGGSCKKTSDDKERGI